jgi:hypothetical protein
MGYLILITLQLAALAAAAVFFWRRIEGQRAEIEALKQSLQARQEGGAQHLRRVVEAGAATLPISPRAVRPVRALGLDVTEQIEALRRLTRNLPVSQETMRGAALGIASIAPALAFIFHVDHALIVACGLCVAGGMMLLGLRNDWRAAAWGSAPSGAAWALIGLSAGVAQADTIAFSVAAALAGACGLVFSIIRKALPGALLTLAMAIALLVLGALVGMIGAAGVAFAALVALAAVVGALSLKIEAIHLGAFGATLLGLFVMSGQASAAIWFTPVAAWAGALFLAIAAFHTPRLGAHGLAIAGTGAFAPLLAIAAIHDSHQGLADPRAAGAAFAVLAALLGAIIACSARRRESSVEALKLTLWVLATSAFAALCAGIALALPAPLAAPAFAASGAGLAFLNVRAPHRAWRLFACLAVAFSAFDAVASVALVLGEAPAWDPRMAVVAGIAAPAALAAAAGYFAQRAQVLFTAGLSKTVAIALSVAAADVLVRLLFSGGAPLLQPIGFVEAGFHIAAWLAISLYVAGRARRYPSAARMGAALVLAAGALAMSAVAAALWVTPYWATLAPPRVAWPALRADALGFAAPALLFWAHWVFWRARGSNIRTRVAMGSAALMTACAVTLEVMRMRDGGGNSDTVSALIGALSFALAIVINFAPGVVAAEPRHGSDLEENLQRDRRSEQRRQAR